MSSRSVPSLRERLQAGDRLVGTLLRMPAEELVEMVAVAGLDFVLVDAEHGSADLADLRHHVTAAESFGLPVLVRGAERDPGFVLRALDLGAAGVVGPHVDSADDARALVSAARYPPLGDRGFATYSRAGAYGSTDREQHRAAGDDALLVAMLETPSAVAAAADVVDVPGIDGYLIGTSDLAATRTDDDPPLTDLVAQVHAATLASGAWRADLAGGPDDVHRALAGGAHLVVVNLTQALMGLLRDLHRH